MKLLHSADWHLGSPIVGRTDDQAALLRRELLSVPGKVVAAAKKEGCDLILLSGDLFDGKCSRDTLDAVRHALAEADMPVFIAPGNHDHACYAETAWPENVHIFTKPHMESVSIPALNCRVYGAAFTSPYSDGLLRDFRADAPEAYAIGVLHADPTAPNSPYCPVTSLQVRESGLDYLALGHIHKGGTLRAGATLCAWPGCPMGRGFDETGEKGVLIVTLGSTAEASFLTLDTIRFYDWEADAANDPAAALSRLLPAAPTRDFYRITLTGECREANPDALRSLFPHLPNLQLRDRTVPPMDLWAAAGDDTLEGVYFTLLRQALDDADETQRQRIILAARLSRKLLDRQEVVLP